MCLSANIDQDALRALADRHRFTFGTCATADGIRNNIDGGRYTDVLASDFNLVEPENDLKPPALWQAEGKIEFKNADVVIDFAQKHKMKARGHVLVYARDDGYTIPRWLLAKEKDVTPEAAKAMLRDYIHQVVGHFKGKIAMWDVANEAIDDRPNSNPYNLRNSFWFRKLGVDFLTLSFQFAHEADPKAELYYNEYGVEGGGKKTGFMMDLVRDLKKKGAPIHGVGLQYHIGMWFKTPIGEGFRQTMADIEKAGLFSMITELDVALPAKPANRGEPEFGTVAANPEDLKAQADRFAAVIEMARSFKSCHGVQLWGFTDKHSWIPGLSGGRNGVATPRDADYKIKPAYEAIRGALSK